MAFDCVYSGPSQERAFVLERQFEKFKWCFILVYPIRSFQDCLLRRFFHGMCCLYSFLFHRNWSATESLKSSTWRELATVKYSLEAFNNNLAGHRVRWNTDNQNVVRIVQVRSMTEELQELALDIFLFASSHNIRLDLAWIPRDQNSEADRFSKVVDIDDYSVHDDVFIHLDRLWGPHSIDNLYIGRIDPSPKWWQQISGS